MAWPKKFDAQFYQQLHCCDMFWPTCRGGGGGGRLILKSRGEVGRWGIRVNKMNRDKLLLGKFAENAGD